MRTENTEVIESILPKEYKEALQIVRDFLALADKYAANEFTGNIEKSIVDAAHAVMGAVALQLSYPVNPRKTFQEKIEELRMKKEKEQADGVHSPSDTAD